MEAEKPSASVTCLAPCERFQAVRQVDSTVGAMTCYPRYTTRHRASTCYRASTSKYSLTFSVRFLLPERHQRKPAVQAAAVMLRTPPSTANHWRTSHAHYLYTARNFKNAPVTRQSAASSARRPRPAGRSHYVVISRDGRKLVTRVRVMLP